MLAAPGALTPQQPPQWASMGIMWVALGVGRLGCDGRRWRMLRLLMLRARDMFQDARRTLGSEVVFGARALTGHQLTCGLTLLFLRQATLDAVHAMLPSQHPTTSHNRTLSPQTHNISLNISQHLSQHLTRQNSETDPCCRLRNSSDQPVQLGWPGCLVEVNGKGGQVQGDQGQRQCQWQAAGPGPGPEAPSGGTASRCSTPPLPPLPPQRRRQRRGRSRQWRWSWCRCGG